MRFDFRETNLYRLIADYFLFLFFKEYQPLKEKNFFRIGVGTFIIGVSGYVLMIFMTMILNIVYSPPDIIVQKSEILNYISEFPILIIVPIFIVPLTEELGFRLLLVYNKFYILISILAFYVSLYITSQKGISRLVKHDFSSFITLEFVVFVTVAILLFVVFSIRSIGLKIEKIWNKNKWYLTIFLSLIFAFLHADLQFVVHNLPWIAVSVIPFFVLGSFFSYIRVNSGFGFAVFSHIIWNLPPSLAMLFYN